VLYGEGFTVLVVLYLSFVMVGFSLHGSMRGMRPRVIFKSPGLVTLHISFSRRSFYDKELLVKNTNSDGELTYRLRQV